MPGQASARRHVVKQFVWFWLLLCCGLTVAACSSSDNTFKCGDPAPQLTADGREVIYNRAICETPAGCWWDCPSRIVDSHLQVYDVETQAIARLPFGTSVFDVSSDGKVIAYPSGSLLEIYDRESGNTTSVDVTEFGSFWGPPPSPSISGDGQVVAFTLLVKSDDPWDSAIFLYDRATEQIRRATTQPRSEWPSLSNDGRFLAYQTRPDLTPDAWEPANAIHILDLASGENTLVSVNSEGDPGNGRSFEPFISGDGRFVVFRSSATDLLAPSTSPPRIEGAEVYLHNRETGALSLLSTAADSAEPSGTSTWVIGSQSRSHAVSTDAQFVVYQSDADNIVPVEDEASVPVDNVYRQDVETDRTTRVSINSLGQPANGFMTHPSVSDDGRLIAFQTTATNLDPDDLDEDGDVYLHDVRSGETTWVNRD
jgi:Tol biopolymer transport system component